MEISYHITSFSRFIYYTRYAETSVIPWSVIGYNHSLRGMQWFWSTGSLEQFLSMKPCLPSKPVKFILNQGIISLAYQSNIKLISYSHSTISFNEDKKKWETETRDHIQTTLKS